MATPQPNSFSTSNEFLTKDMEFFLVRTLFEVRRTGVTIARADLPTYSLLIGDFNDPDTGSPFATDADYDDGFWSQTNYNTLVTAINYFSQPVQLGSGLRTDLSAGGSTDPSGETLDDYGFGSDFSTADTGSFWTTKFSVEHKSVLAIIGGTQYGLLQNLLAGSGTFSIAYQMLVTNKNRAANQPFNGDTAGDLVNLDPTTAATINLILSQLEVL